MKAKFLFSILSAALFSAASFAQFPGGGFGGGFPGGGGGFPGGGFPGGFGGRFPFDPQEEGGQMPGGFPGGGGGFGGGFMMGTEYDPTTTRNDVEFTSSNLPIVIIQTDNKTLTNREKTGATMKVIDNGKGRNKVTDPANGYDGKIKIKLRGNSSLFFDQKRFTFETVTAEGKANDVELLGMPADNDWVLLAPYNDVSMMRDVFAFDMWNNMGHWAPRTRYCEVVMNGKYIGVYTLCEKIKRGKDRIDIDKLTPKDTSALDITGGYIVRVDPPDEGEKSFQSEVPGIMNSNIGGAFGGFGGGMGGFGGFGGRNTVTWTIFYPKAKNLTDDQQKYISDYVNTVEKVIQSDYFADPEKGYAKYIDVESFVDYFIHTELSLNADGLKRSTYFYKEKQNADGTGGKLHAGTVWDYNLAYGNCNFANANNIEAWVYEGSETNPTPAMWKRLTEDPAFMAKVKARWKELRKGYLSNDNINSFIDERAALLKESQARQYTKYSDLLVPKREGSQSAQGQPNGGFGGFGGDMGGFGGGFPGGGFGGGGGAAGMFSAYTVSSYDEEIGILKKFFADRIAFLDKNWK